MYLDVQLVWFSPLDFIYICHMYVSMWVCWEEAIKILQVRLCIKFALCKFIYLDSQIISVESVFDFLSALETDTSCPPRAAASRVQHTWWWEQPGLLPGVTAVSIQAPPSCSSEMGEAYVGGCRLAVFL